jgi:hypothetical protein
MRNKNNGITLPGRSMEEAARNAQKSFLANETIADTIKSQSQKRPKASDPAPKNKSALPADELQCLQESIQRYTSIKEHGMSVWVIGKVKTRLDELKFRTGNKVGCRAFTNAALEFVLDKYGDELVKTFSKN